MWASCASRIYCGGKTMAGQIAVVGPKDAVLAFRALGVTVAPAREPEAVSQARFRLAKEGYAVIFVTEEEAEGAKEMIARFAAEPLPAIIPIPGASGANGFGMRAVRANVEKAVGVDILLEKKGEE